MQRKWCKCDVRCRSEPQRSLVGPRQEATTTWAKARVDSPCVRGAEAPLFHGRAAHGGARTVVHAFTMFRQLLHRDHGRLIILVGTLEISNLVVAFEMPDAGGDFVDQIMIVGDQENRTLIAL